MKLTKNGEDDVKRLEDRSRKGSSENMGFEGSCGKGGKTCELGRRREGGKEVELTVSRLLEASRRIMPRRKKLDRVASPLKSYCCIDDESLSSSWRGGRREREGGRKERRGGQLDERLSLRASIDTNLSLNQDE